MRNHFAAKVENDSINHMPKLTSGGGLSIVLAYLMRSG